MSECFNRGGSSGDSEVAALAHDEITYSIVTVKAGRQEDTLHEI